ncbi:MULTISPECIES: RraA family protein [unclassified Herbaspirillum]|uniref:RraA family protein n=1 Tax=unclassified Herbaspirillum TaxID=2624150 RepID=UPI001154B798|nr:MULTISPECIES: RraA family protein [unclassified Herbaspirillum]MBB5391194.1 RraA family protein [Herbaspirillum sp. SJZ102]TQK13115.1 RraA family protein [Herbaspirillum sp. SJZ130]TQK15119.1 RraA family protein [Herbaspirillum sp. SJZ106]TWC67466.1 RraA family protein [Herbaspirillum sp. SJZ099]
MSTTKPDLIRDIERVDAAIVAQASEFPASILADVAGRRGTLCSRISPLSPSMRVAGPALTVEVRPGDNLMIHAAMAIAKPGDVLVIDGKGDETCALLGEIMVSQCKAIGMAGIVIFGSVRDTEAIREIGFPVYAVGANPNGPTKNIAGRVNWPVSVGGASVQPGDLIVGDADGVVVVEREKAPTLLAAAAKKVQDETKRLSEIRTGGPLRPGWLDSALRKAGALQEGETL